MRAIIFINGELRAPARVARLVQPGDRLIGADGGTRHLLALDFRPHLVVGDLDSLDPDTVARLAAEGVVIERHSVHKNQTDLELALECALRDGATEIVLVGATGGRLDQTLANVLILAQRKWPVPVRLLDGTQEAFLVRGPGQVTIDAAPDATLSVIPLSARVTGITYTGLAYPLENATLRLGSTRGISNVVERSPATVSVRSGLLLVVVERGSAP